MSKSTIHFILIVIALAAIFNNLIISETKAEEFGQKTVLAAMITGFEEMEITETAITSTKKTTDYCQRLGVLDYSEAGWNELNKNGTPVAVTSELSAALVKPAMSGTTIGDRPREEVIYYIVEGGDTISTIAEKFNISTDTILWENKLTPKDYIKPGDKLTILPQSGVSHQVASGETVGKIAEKYKVTTEEILEYNKLADATAIEKGRILIIPGASVPQVVRPTIPRQPTAAFASQNIPPSAANTSGTNLLWPTTGHKISQYYKWGHLAIDITGDYSSPLYASDPGRVEASGWGSGYGNRVIINHGNGIKTLYAHASKLFVSTGDYVERGQTIAMMGCTGWCTGTHIHFEVIVNGTKVNPLNYL